MADFNQFGSVKPGSAADPQHCAQYESMLTDVLDGTLSPADQATFDLHIVGCPNCADMLADARRGAAWLEMLHSPRPQPPANLLDRILSQTSALAATQTGVQASASANAQSGLDAYPSLAPGSKDSLALQPVRTPNTLFGRPMLVSPSVPAAAAFSSSNVLPFRTRIHYGLRSLGHTMLQPRLAMTAAMAFFSIALTLNLTGIRLSQFRASDLKPSSILRSCYEAKAKVVRYSDNLRVVYELESRVRDLQHSSDDDGRAAQSGQAGSSSTPQPQSDPATKPVQKPADGQHPPNDQNPDQKQSRPRPNPGSSRRELPNGSIREVELSRPPSSLPAPADMLAVLSSRMYKPEGGLV